MATPAPSLTPIEPSPAPIEDDKPSFDILDEALGKAIESGIDINGIINEIITENTIEEQVESSNQKVYS